MLTTMEQVAARTQLRSEIRQRDGMAFQSLFADIMVRRYRDDFSRVAPWGRDGDRKNDGYLRSARQLFQCYAPKELAQQPMLAKIDTDFKGALPHWEAHFDEWVLVHNELEGTPAWAEQRLRDFEEIHRPLRLSAWGFDHLKDRLLALSRTDVVEIVGQLATDEDFASLEFNDILSVLKHVAATEPAEDLPVIPVPSAKLEANLLSEDVKHLIRSGLRKAQLVRETINRHYDPELGDRTAAWFRRQYQELRSRGLSGDEIFDDLKLKAGFPRSDSRRQAASIALLTHLFESCDIFEAPRP